jgi:hypothetical protein
MDDDEGVGSSVGWVGGWGGEGTGTWRQRDNHFFTLYWFVSCVKRIIMLFRNKVCHPYLFPLSTSVLLNKFVIW